MSGGGAAPARVRPRGLPAGICISVCLHAGLLGGGWVLFGRPTPPAPRPLVLARVEFVEPRSEVDAVAEEEADTALAALEAVDDPLDRFEPLETLLEELVPPEDPDAPPEAAPVEIPAIPLSAVKVRVRPPPPPAPATRPASRPRVASSPPRPRRGAPLRVVHRPDVAHYYPVEAQRRGIEGTAYVEIRVDPSGTVVDARLVRSSGSRLLDAQALRVMYAHRFAAGEGGRARVPVVFSLR